MDFVLFRINYVGDVLLNNNLRVRAPFVMKWFSGVDLFLKTTNGENDETREFVLNTRNMPSFATKFGEREFFITLPEIEKMTPETPNHNTPTENSTTENAATEKQLTAEKISAEKPISEKPTGTAQVLKTFEHENLKILLTKQGDKTFLAINNSDKKQLIKL